MEKTWQMKQLRWKSHDENHNPNKENSLISNGRKSVEFPIKQLMASHENPVLIQPILGKTSGNF
jgi:hypothetical protein